MSKKKYNLHCFGCGLQFYSKEDVYRSEGKPYCGECMANSTSAEHDIFLEEEWHRNNPGVDYEQWEIDRANIRKYGEC